MADKEPTRTPPKRKRVPPKRKQEPKRVPPTLKPLGHVSPTPLKLKPAFEPIVIPKKLKVARTVKQHMTSLATINEDQIDTSHILIPSLIDPGDSYDFLGEESGTVIDTTMNSSPQEVELPLFPKRWEKMYAEKISFYINKLTPLSSIPSETKRWIRNAPDERAAQEGMRFSEARGLEVVDWVQSNCVLYEGSRAGELITIDDWQFEYFMQLFGWLMLSDELGRWIRRFNQAGIWIAKKNAKSPTLAATGLYNLCADGELGNHCYSVARDGKQALISHTHAIKMVEMSETLSRVCQIKKTDYSITHHPTKSTYTLVHADNSLSTEGFNGSIFVDETHVVDQAQIDRIKRAGISRDEPLHIEMSTAGNNADGYGYNRYCYGLRVSKMESSNDYIPNFLFIDFSIDQKVSMDKLRDEEFVTSIAQACNPALGRILRLSEFKSDYRESVRSETELRQFAMYRLNLWLHGAISWVELADWLACANSPLKEEINYYEDNDRQYTLDDLREYPCVLGMDLSKVKDMTAISAIFAVPDENLGVRPYTWTWHWMPRVTANSYNNHVDFYNEEFRPWLHLMDTPTIDYKQIIDHLDWLYKTFDVRAMGYDVWNSTELVRILTDVMGWDETTLIKVPQSMRYLGPITQEFERWIIRKEVHHPNNSLLSWQVGHAALDMDRFGNYRIMKPPKGAYQKVDGLVSLMIAGAVLCSPVSADIWGGRTSLLLYEMKQRTDTDQFNTLDPRNLY